jgi:hypothetical protein
MFLQVIAEAADSPPAAELCFQCFLYLQVEQPLLSVECHEMLASVVKSTAASSAQWK